MDLCEDLRHREVWIDFKKELKIFVEGRGRSAIDIKLSDFEATLEAKFSKLPARIKAAVAPVVDGQEISTLEVATYDLANSKSWIRSARIVVSADFKPIITDERVDAISLDHSFIYWRFGEVDYVDSIARDGTLARLFQDPKTLPFFNTQKRVGQVTRDQAVDAAVDYISTVGEAARALSPGFHPDIGGPVDVLFAGPDIAPDRIRWKEISH